MANLDNIKNTGIPPTSPISNGDLVQETANKTTEIIGKKVNTALVEQARSESIQSRGKSAPTTGIGFQLIFQGNELLPPWWSTARDSALEDFWKANDLMSGAVYAMASKMATIPFHIEAKDMSRTKDVKLAEIYERRLYEGAEFGDGWTQFFERNVMSLLTQDNGRFFEIIDRSSNKVGPITGQALTVAHLDPSRCQRTGNARFPIIYHKTDGDKHKLHYTRVAFDAHLPSTKVDMFGVGFCAVSRASNYTQTMIDIARYKQEKLGSRPMRGIMLLGGGLDAESVGLALGTAQSMADAKGHRMFSQLPLIGQPDIEAPTLELISLSSLPDGFDEKTATTIAMAAYALAFGVDARELWPAQESGTTRADALLSHIKQRGKGPGHILRNTELLFNRLFLPTSIRMVFDFQDDAQDRQVAEIRKSRSDTRETNLQIAITDERVEREQMLKDGELTQPQFNELELSDGRLPDGKPIETLFFSPEPVDRALLSIPQLSEPLNVNNNDPENAIKLIDKQINQVYNVLAQTKNDNEIQLVKQTLAALEHLRERYEKRLAIQLVEEQQREADRDKPSGEKPNESGIQSSLNKRPDSEDESARLENNPRELKEIPDMDIRKALQKVRRRKTNNPMQKVLNGLEEYMLENTPDPVQPIVKVEPVIEVHMPQPQTLPPAEVNITVEKQDMPEIIVQAPVSVEAPNVNIEPQIIIKESDRPALEKGTDAKYEVVEVLERDEQGNIKRVKRERVDKDEK